MTNVLVLREVGMKHPDVYVCVCVCVCVRDRENDRHIERERQIDGGIVCTIVSKIVLPLYSTSYVLTSP